MPDIVRPRASTTGVPIGVLLTILLILLLIGLLPTWGYSRSWGYAPFGGGLGLVLPIVVIVLLV